MSKDNTGLLIIGGIAAFLFLIPKETRQQILPSGGGVTTMDLGGITTGLPGLPEGGLNQLQQQIQAGLFNLQLQGMKSLFDIQLAGLRTAITNLPQPQELIPGLPGGGGLPGIQDIIDQFKEGLNLPTLPGLPALPGLPGITDQGKTEEGKEDKWGTTPYIERAFGERSIIEMIFGKHAISESGVYQDVKAFVERFTPGGDGREDTPEANQRLPQLAAPEKEAPVLGVYDIPGFQFPGGKRYFLPSGGETTRGIFKALQKKGYEFQVLTEAPDKPEAEVDTYSPTAADYSSPGSPWYGASM